MRWPSAARWTTSRAHTPRHYDHTKLIAARDPNGFRPLCIGELPDGNGYAFASESCALDAVGAKFVRDVRPGEIVIADRNGLRTMEDHCGTAPHTIVRL